MKHITLVGFELEPCTAARNDLGVVDGAVACLVLLGCKIHAGAADELADHNALGAVDDEGAAGGHQREIANEDFLLLHLARCLVDETNLDEQGRLITDVLFLAFFDRVLRVAEFMLAKLDTHVLRGILDGTDVCERLVKAFGDKPFETIDLDANQIGNVHDVRDLRERPPFPISAGGSGSFALSHERLPPSGTARFPQKCTVL